ncbi:MAG: PAS domain-containing protein [Candidatus Omnitrophica bacterium]|nr:PAS domain-containing protein [Candidatus Omnitrophota bacterium]
MKPYSIAKMLREVKGIQEEPKEEKLTSSFAKKPPRPADETKNDFLEFLSTKAQAFDEFGDMSSFVASILRASGYPFFVVDKSMRIQYMNPACLDFTGIKLDDTIGKVDCMNVFNSNLCGKSCAIKQAIQTRKPVIGKRVKVTDKFGKEHSIIVSAGPLLDSKGRVLGGFEVWRDAMPDEEVNKRVSRLLETIRSYCREMDAFLVKLMDKGIEKEVRNQEEWKEYIGEMINNTDNLLHYSRSLLKSSCWDIVNCPPERQVQCPAFPNNGVNCWEIDYTWCDGQMQGKANEKRHKCNKCIVRIRDRHFS